MCESNLTVCLSCHAGNLPFFTFMSCQQWFDGFSEQECVLLVISLLILLMFSYMDFFILLFFFFCPLIWDLGRRSRPLFALLPSPAPLGEHQGVPELYGSYKTYLVVSSWLEMFITTHCYIFVLVGFFRCLKDPGSHVVMEIQENFTKQPPKEDVSAVTPGLSPRKGPVEEHLVTTPEYIFYFSLGQKYLLKNYIHDTWPANKINFLLFSLPSFLSFCHVLFLPCWFRRGAIEVTGGETL